MKNRLIELLNPILLEYLDAFGNSGKIAEHLIANGVTIQRWIPVEERLPEKFITVIVQMPGEKPLPTVTWGFLTDDGWYANYFVRDLGEVTHWMPLPEPPKEEA